MHLIKRIAWKLKLKINICNGENLFEVRNSLHYPVNKKFFHYDLNIKRMKDFFCLKVIELFGSLSSPYATLKIKQVDRCFVHFERKK